MLSQDEADEFMAAPKVVPDHGRPFEWSVSSGSYAVWRSPVEIRSAEVGEIFLVANRAVDQHWTCKLQRFGDEVYRLDVRPVAVKHKNPPNAPVGFPNRVRSRVHEHSYREGFKTDCAMPMVEFPGDHTTLLKLFCNRTNVSFEGPYKPPPAIQLQIDFR